MKKSQDISINRLNLRLEETKNELNLCSIENELLKKSDMKEVINNLRLALILYPILKIQFLFFLLYL